MIGVGEGIFSTNNILTKLFVGNICCFDNALQPAFQCFTSRFVYSFLSKAFFFQWEFILKNVEKQTFHWGYFSLLNTSFSLSWNGNERSKWKGCNMKISCLDYTFLSILLKTTCDAYINACTGTYKAVKSAKWSLAWGLS